MFWETERHSHLRTVALSEVYYKLLFVLVDSFRSLEDHFFPIPKFPLNTKNDNKRPPLIGRICMFLGLTRLIMVVNKCSPDGIKCVFERPSTYLYTKTMEKN